MTPRTKKVPEIVHRDHEGVHVTHPAPSDRPAETFPWDQKSTERTTLMDRLDMIQRMINCEWANGTTSQAVRDASVSQQSMILRFFDQQRLYKEHMEMMEARHAADRAHWVELMSQAQFEAHERYSKNLATVVSTMTKQGVA